MDLDLFFKGDSKPLICNRSSKFVSNNGSMINNAAELRLEQEHTRPRGRHTLAEETTLRQADLSSNQLVFSDEVNYNRLRRDSIRDHQTAKLMPTSRRSEKKPKRLRRGLRAATKSSTTQDGPLQPYTTKPRTSIITRTRGFRRNTQEQNRDSPSGNSLKYRGGYRHQSLPQSSTRTTTTTTNPLRKTICELQSIY